MIVATAGHVDHGKTSLVKHLTGVDTDRLAEEKRRGLSISLGFAYRRVDEKTSIAFIDVPGHKSFINNMISGISGIDFGMLVVAADDGVMPQTLEHLEVLTLLGVTSIVVVVSKVDRVDSARIQVVREQLHSLLPDSPLFEVSNTCSDHQSGICELQAYLDYQATRRQARSGEGLFRMSIDRSFTLKGSGLVVTGTILDGVVAVGDSLQLQSGALRDVTKVRIRRIHSQNEEADSGRAGQRCALNIVGDVDKQLLKRGDYLSDSDCIEPSDRFDARIQISTNINFPIKHMQRVKAYVGAKRVAAKLYILKGVQSAEQNKNAEGRRVLTAGANTIVQIVLQEPVQLCHGDRFLLRDDSESINVAGGTVLSPQALPWGKGQLQRFNSLLAMDQNDALSVLREVVVEEQQSIDYSTFRLSWNITENKARQYLQDRVLQDAAALITLEGRRHLVPKTLLKTIKVQICQCLEKIHYERPMEDGVSITELSNSINVDSEMIFNAALSELLKQQALKKNNGLVYVAGHRSTISSQVQQRWLLLSKILRNGGFQVPLLSEIEKKSGLSEKQLSALIIPALKNGDLVMLNDKRYMLVETKQSMEEEIKSLSGQRHCFSVVDVKSHLGLGRNLTIEILEYFDSIQFTQRKNDGRELLL